MKEVRQRDLNEWYWMCCWNLLSVDNWINHHWSTWQWQMKRNWERTTVIVILPKEWNLLGLIILLSPSIAEYKDNRQIPSTEWLPGTARAGKNLCFFITRFRFLGFLGFNVRTVVRSTLDTGIRSRRPIHEDKLMHCYV